MKIVFTRSLFCIIIGLNCAMLESFQATPCVTQPCQCHRRTCPRHCCASSTEAAHRHSHAGDQADHRTIHHATRSCHLAVCFNDLCSHFSSCKHVQAYARDWPSQAQREWYDQAAVARESAIRSRNLINFKSSLASSPHLI